jgi:hypothetical protein
MTRLKLRLDDLAVETFDATPAKAERGTVVGRQESEPTLCTDQGCVTACYLTCHPTCQPETCADTCGETCFGPNTCPHPAGCS